MKRPLFSHAAVLLAAFSTAQLTACRSFPANNAQGESSAIRMTHGGRERTFRLYVPPSNASRTGPFPLILALHGGGGDAKSMERLTLYGFNRIADREGALVAYPEGIGKHWNCGRMIDGSEAHEEDVDDTGFLSALIDRLAAGFSADPKRVLVTGMSNGGFMSHRLAVELPDKIAAAAPVGAAVQKNLLQAPAGRPVPVLMICGAEDWLVPIEGGHVQGLFRKRGEILSAEESARFWCERNGCSFNPAESAMPDLDPEDGTRTVRKVYKPSGLGAQVVQMIVNGGGHTWPGGWQYLGRFAIGKTSRDFDACEEIWKFFKGGIAGAE